MCSVCHTNGSGFEKGVGKELEWCIKFVLEFFLCFIHVMSQAITVITIYVNYLDYNTFAVIQLRCQYPCSLHYVYKYKLYFNICLIICSTLTNMQ